MIQYIILFLFGFITGIILPILPVHIVITLDGGYSEYNIKRFFYMGALMYIITIIVSYGYGNPFTNGILISATMILLMMVVLWHKLVKNL